MKKKAISKYQMMLQRFCDHINSKYNAHIHVHYIDKRHSVSGFVIKCDIYQSEPRYLEVKEPENFYWLPVPAFSYEQLFNVLASHHHCNKIYIYDINGYKLSIDTSHIGNTLEELNIAIDLDLI